MARIALRGRLAEAERAFVSGIAGWRAASQHTVAAWGCHHLGRLVAAQRTEHAADRRVPLGCLCRLLRAFDVQRSGPRVPAAVPGMVEQLTARELEVLGLLAAGRPNQAIAAELVVSLAGSRALPGWPS